MPLIVHGSPTSICTRRIFGIVAQAGLWDKVTLADVGEDWSIIKSEDWLNNHQPVGQLPYLEDTDAGIEVFESRAIAKYILLKYKSPLMPTTDDLVAFSKFEAACSLEFADYESFATRITYELIFKKNKGEPINEGVLNMAQGALIHRLQGYNRLLAKHKYLAGDEVTAVDMFHLPFGEAMLQVDSAPALVDGSLPNVARWWKDISALKGWNEAKAAMWGDELPRWGKPKH